MKTEYAMDGHSFAIVCEDAAEDDVWFNVALSCIKGVNLGAIILPPKGEEGHIRIIFNTKEDFLHMNISDKQVRSLAQRRKVTIQGEKRKLKEKLLLTIIRSDLNSKVSLDWAIAFRNLSFPCYYDIMNLRGIPSPTARNIAKDHAVSDEFDYLAFLDMNIIAPPDCFVKLIQDMDLFNLDIVGALYFSRSPPFTPVAFIPDPEKIKIPVDISKGGVVPCNYLGLGASMIKTKTFDLFKDESPFIWSAEPDNPMGVSEDFYFTNAAKLRGAAVACDTRVIAKHEFEAIVDETGAYPVL